MKRVKVFLIAAWLCVGCTAGVAQAQNTVKGSVVVISGAARHPAFRNILSLDKQEQLTAKQVQLLGKAIQTDPIAPALHTIVTEPDLTYGELIARSTPAVTIPWVRVARYIRTLGVAVAYRGDVTACVKAVELLDETARFLSTGTVSQLPQSWAYRSRARELITFTLSQAKTAEDLRYGLEAAKCFGYEPVSYDLERAIQTERKYAPHLLVAEGVLPPEKLDDITDLELLNAQQTNYVNRKRKLAQFSSKQISTANRKAIRAGINQDIASVSACVAAGGSYEDWLRSVMEKRLKGYGNFQPELAETVDRVSWDLIVLVAARKLYRLENDREADLADLVPKYLDAIPRDPFDSGGGTYRVSGPRVYSFGHDGDDDQGLVRAYQFPPPGKDFGYEGDLVLSLPE